MGTESGKENPIEVGFALNNLAVVSWFHHDAPPLATNDQNARIENLWKNSIRIIEESNKELRDGEQSAKDQGLRGTLLMTERVGKISKKEEEDLDPSLRMLLRSKFSGVPVMNLGEFLLGKNEGSDSVSPIEFE